MLRLPARSLALRGCVTLLLCAAAAGANRPASYVAARFELPAIPLAEFETWIANDRGLLLGGCGSDLWRSPDDPAGRFWMVTDRGPNGEVEAGGKKRRTFPVPDFAPAILEVRARDGAIEIERTIALTDEAGRRLTGLPNDPARDEKPYACDGSATLAYDPDGIDTEALVRLRDGSFFVAEEYAPSLLKVDARGHVRKRFVPRGTPTQGARLRTTPSLPAILSRRAKNRGFEALALSPDESTLFAALQSPLANPDSATGERSASVRLLAFDVATSRVVGEYVYRLDDWRRFDRRARSPSDMKISALVATAAERLLVLERTDDVARIYETVLTPRFDVLGSGLDALDAVPSLEALDDPAAAGVPVLEKWEIARLDPSQQELPRKIEGLAIVDERTIAIANDDDFDVGSMDATGAAPAIERGRRTRSEIVLLRIPFELR